MATVNVPIEIRFKDIDALGHVNNAVVITYFEEGRKRFFLREMQKEKIHEFNFILAHVRCDYLLPIRLTDRLELHLWVEAIGTKSFTIGYQLQAINDPARIFARGLSVQVYYDYQHGKSVAVPAPMRTLLATYLKDT